MCKNSNKIFSNTIGEVSRCQCGTVHIAIPGQTIHLTTNAFMQLSALLQESSNIILESEFSKVIKNNFGEKKC
jgi:hypothetical protein